MEQSESKSSGRVFVDITPAKLDPNLVDNHWPLKSGFLQQIQVDQSGASKVESRSRYRNGRECDVFPVA